VHRFETGTGVDAAIEVKDELRDDALQLIESPGPQPGADSIAFVLAVAAAAGLVDAVGLIAIETLWIAPEHDRVPDFDGLSRHDDGAARGLSGLDGARRSTRRGWRGGGRRGGKRRQGSGQPHRGCHAERCQKARPASTRAARGAGASLRETARGAGGGPPVNSCQFVRGIGNRATSPRFDARRLDTMMRFARVRVRQAAKALFWSGFRASATRGISRKSGAETGGATPGRAPEGPARAG